MAHVPSNTPLLQRGAALTALLTAVLVLVANIADFGWSAEQTTAASGLLAAAVFFLFILAAHLHEGSTQERVLLGGAFTGLVSALVAVILVFGLWGIDEAEGASLVTIAGLLVTTIASFGARSAVTAQVTGEPPG